MEVAWMHKRKGKFYFNYHTKYNKEVDPANPDDPERKKFRLDYSMGTFPTGPLIYMGPINTALGVNVENGPKLPGKNYVLWLLKQSNNGSVIPVKQTVEGVGAVEIDQPFYIMLQTNAVALIDEETVLSLDDVDLGSGYYFLT